MDRDLNFKKISELHFQAQNIDCKQKFTKIKKKINFVPYGGFFEHFRDIYSCIAPFSPMFFWSRGKMSSAGRPRRYEIVFIKVLLKFRSNAGKRTSLPEEYASIEHPQLSRSVKSEIRPKGKVKAYLLSLEKANNI